ncbi:MAG: hypothetical protein Q4D71_13235 [Oscillospiraceae bacterium]|nr:hypothetical protein [Oscillospiraceae bacterium]
MEEAFVGILIPDKNQRKNSYQFKNVTLCESNKSFMAILGEFSDCCHARNPTNCIIYGNPSMTSAADRVWYRIS